MTITQNPIDHLTALLTVKVSPDDYVSHVEKIIKEKAKKIKMAGFRPGQVPWSYVKRVYGKSILVEEINYLLNNELNKYLQENTLHILGQPLPTMKEEQNTFKWDFSDNFEFNYEIGLAPSVGDYFSSEDKLQHYVVKIDDLVVREYISYLRQEHSKAVKSELSPNNHATYIGLKQLISDVSLFREGMPAGPYFNSKTLTVEELQQTLLNLKKQEHTEVKSPKVLVSESLGVNTSLTTEEEEAQQESYNVSNSTPPAEENLNQQFFDAVLGKDVAQTEEEFKEKVAKKLEWRMTQDAEQKLKRELYQLGLDKFDFELPEEFLKRWLKATNEEISEETLQNEYVDFSKKLKWLLVENKITKDQGFDVTPEELFEKAKNHIAALSQKYGLDHLPADSLEASATQFLQKKENASRLLDSIRTSQIFDYLKNVVTLDKVEVTPLEFVQLL